MSEHKITEYPERCPARQFYDDVIEDKVSVAELEEGDRFAQSISWYGDLEESRGRPVIFEVVSPISELAKETLERGQTPMASVKARGSDGALYKIYVDNVHVECLDDDKGGYDRGTKSGSKYRVEMTPEEVETY